MVRSGVVTTLILLSIAFGYVFMTNWKVYEMSLHGKGMEPSGEAGKDRKSDTNKILVGSNLVAVVAPLTKSSNTITISVEAPEREEEEAGTLCEVIHHTDSDIVTEKMRV